MERGKTKKTRTIAIMIYLNETIYIFPLERRYFSVEQLQLRDACNEA